MCRQPPHIALANFITEILFIVIGVPIRAVESLVVSKALQFLVIALVNDWPSAFAGFIYGFVLSMMILLPLAHYFVLQSPGLCTFYVAWMCWIVGQLAHAFVSYLREVPGIQQSCITDSALCSRWRLRKPSYVGYTGLLVGLLFASSIATPVLPGIEPVIQRVQFCRPLLNCPIWLLATSVFVASYVTAGVYVDKITVPAFAGQERLPMEDQDSALELSNTMLLRGHRENMHLEQLNGSGGREWGGMRDDADGIDAKAE